MINIESALIFYVLQWDLVCSHSWLKAMAQSIYMFGFLVGAIGFGSLSDR